jgi:hypothetical protein
MWLSSSIERSWEFSTAGVDATALAVSLPPCNPQARYSQLSSQHAVA